MNNIKKAALGVLIAGFAFGFSAFTTFKRANAVLYYKVDIAYPLPDDPRGYYYYSGDRCEANGPVCSALWDIGTNMVPVADGTSLPGSGRTLISTSVSTGHFE
ncbi:hypothetical protein HQN86_22480 [Pedobacter panaciterrae]|jgi:hypothetical protein|uniref:hypothetical protein n=1 Tax=Pedobacter panaciterrae TaxID=363849 RepID=UPI00155DC163|nr:hypothetical protein [Pedobacter panaciterrae]NQX56402.1 hypothetical protein [Pedobacter panaciterrae]